MERTKENEENLVEFCCGICFEVMSWSKVPRMLPCGHSFCSSCLKKITNLGNTKKEKEREELKQESSPLFQEEEKKTSKSCSCPFCREEFDCDLVENLKVNYTLSITADLLSSSPSPFSLEEMKCVNYETCGQRTQMYCPKCELFICELCDPFHTSTIFTQNHSRIRQQQQQQQQQPLEWNDGRFSKSKRCSEHPSEVANAYCFECRIFVCICCVLNGPHENHRENVSPFEECVRKKRQQVLKIGGVLKQQMKEVEKKKRVIEEEVQDLEEEQKKLEDEMQLLKEKLVQKQQKRKEVNFDLDEIRMKQDTIDRLSRTPKGFLILDEDVYSTIVEAATNLVGEQQTRKQKLVLVWNDPSRTPLRISVNVPRDGNIFDLKEAISKLIGIPPEPIHVAEVYQSKFFKEFINEDHLSEIRPNDFIYAFELTNNFGDLSFSSKKIDNGNVLHLRVIQRRTDNYELFSIPTICSVSETTTYKQLYKKMVHTIQRRLLKNSNEIKPFFSKRDPIDYSNPLFQMVVTNKLGYQTFEILSDLGDRPVFSSQKEKNIYIVLRWEMDTLSCVYDGKHNDPREIHESFWE